MLPSVAMPSPLPVSAAALAAAEVAPADPPEAPGAAQRRGRRACSRGRPRGSARARGRGGAPRGPGRAQPPVMRALQRKRGWPQRATGRRPVARRCRRRCSRSLHVATCRARARMRLTSGGRARARQGSRLGTTTANFLVSCRQRRWLLRCARREPTERSLPGRRWQPRRAHRRSMRRRPPLSPAWWWRPAWLTGHSRVQKQGRPRRTIRREPRAARPTPGCCAAQRPRLWAREARRLQLHRARRVVCS
jgi:hypothetical protein